MELLKKTVNRVKITAITTILAFVYVGLFSGLPEKFMDLFVLFIQTTLSFVAILTFTAIPTLFKDLASEKSLFITQFVVCVLLLFGFLIFGYGYYGEVMVVLNMVRLFLAAFSMVLVIKFGSYGKAERAMGK